MRILLMLVLLISLAGCSSEVSSDVSSDISSKDKLASISDRFDRINPVMDDQIDEGKLLYQLDVIVKLQQEFTNTDVPHDEQYELLYSNMDNKIYSIRTFFKQRYRAMLDVARTKADIDALRIKVDSDWRHENGVWESQEEYQSFLSEMKEKLDTINEYQKYEAEQGTVKTLDGEQND